MRTRIIQSNRHSTVGVTTEIMDMHELHFNFRRRKNISGAIQILVKLKTLSPLALYMYSSSHSHSNYCDVSNQSRQLNEMNMYTDITYESINCEKNFNEKSTLHNRA